MPVSTRTMVKQRALAKIGQRQAQELLLNTSTIAPHPAQSGTKTCPILTDDVLDDLVRSEWGRDSDGVHDYFNLHAAVFDSFPDSLKDLYKRIANPTEPTTLQGRTDGATEWQLWGLYEIMRVWDMQSRWNTKNKTCVDFGSAYHGLGHYVVASLHLPTQCVYLRLDGGSDGWAHELNSQFAATYVPSDCDLHHIDWWFNLVYEGQPVESMNSYIITSSKNHA